MQLRLRDNLPFVAVRLAHAGVEVEVADALVDTGSARTIVSADAVAAIGIVPEPDDVLRSMRGVGGTEAVFCRRLDRLSVDEHGVAGFEVQVGAMDYGFAINCILGMDFLAGTGAVIDLPRRTLDFAP